MNRRNFLASSVVGIISLHSLSGGFAWNICPQAIQYSIQPSAWSVIPVVGDGKWIWRDPPDKKGYLEPREFEVSIVMTITGTGDSSNLSATTVAPVEFPEQKILDCQIEASGCQARVVTPDEGAAQLVLYADSLAENQSVRAAARYRLIIRKSYFGFHKEQFPREQSRIRQVPKRFLTNSPGIRIHTPAVKEVVRKTVSADTHPWDRANRFYQWVWDNIEGVPGKYTSVEAAMKNRRGDCEERACAFIALCRQAGIPARQVWVPGHVWAEIALHDADGNWFWIPVHTAAYSWFGWTGAHEVVLQKGDRIHVGSRNRNLRLIDDWYQIKGSRPEIAFTADIKPLASSESSDAGPGGRRKLPDGNWALSGGHAADRFMRDQ